MDLVAFIVYFILILGVGIFFFARSKGNGEKEYFLGGRSMGPWVTAMSAQASDMSGWLLMGFPGSILAFGMGKVWIGIGLALGTAANWIFVAKRLRRFSKASGDSITLPQYLTNRFASKSPVLKICAAVIFLISFTVYVASSYVAGQSVMCAVIPALKDTPMLSLGIFAVLILIYTFLGGYKAVCWTDFFQGILMLIALLAVPLVMAAGDFNSEYETAFKFGVDAFGTNPFAASWQDIVTGLGWGLGYFGMPHILVRFMAIEKPSMVKKSATVAIVWVVLSLGAAIAIAVLGRTFMLDEGVSLADTLLPGNGQQIFITVSQHIFPKVIVGFLLAAIVAAAMSTADSQLLVASSAFTSDLYKPLVRKNKASDKELLWIGRAVVVAVSVVAFIIAASGIKSNNASAAKQTELLKDFKAEIAVQFKDNAEHKALLDKIEKGELDSEVKLMFEGIANGDETDKIMEKMENQDVKPLIETLRGSEKAKDLCEDLKVAMTPSWASNIMSMVENAWGLFGAAFGPVVILSLFWRRLNYKGACAGIIVGAVADIAWLVLCTGTIVKNPVFGATGIYEIVPGFIIGLIATVVVTLATKAPGKEVDVIYANATDNSIDD